MIKPRMLVSAATGKIGPAVVSKRLKLFAAAIA